MPDFGIGETLTALFSTDAAATATTAAATTAAAAAPAAAATTGILGTGITAGQLAAGASVVGAAGSLASTLGGRRPVMPPSPTMAQQTIDEGAQQAQEMANQRQSIAGGINSTVGTGNGGQGGSMLNPGNMGGKTLLGE